MDYDLFAYEPEATDAPLPDNEQDYGAQTISDEFAVTNHTPCLGNIETAQEYEN